MKTGEGNKRGISITRRKAANLLYFLIKGSWKLFRELNLLNVDESLVYRKFETLSKGEQTKILLAILFTREDG
ncbi:hypothetical protein GMC85_10510, partial [Streptococcus parasanguinis]|nr:hypothetical protein [Streptococcus parasanguinis]MTS13771.1 hypothetical protein [Streptococcus parasanguinis]